MKKKPETRWRRFVKWSRSSKGKAGGLAFGSAVCAAAFLFALLPALEGSIPDQDDLSIQRGSVQSIAIQNNIDQTTIYLEDYAEPFYVNHSENFDLEAIHASLQPERVVTLWVDEERQVWQLEAEAGTLISYDALTQTNDQQVLCAMCLIGFFTLGAILEILTVFMP